MMRHLARTKQIAIFVICLLLSAYVAPSVALACEGEGEEVKGAISVKPQEWGEGARGRAEDCPVKVFVNFVAVVFGRTRKWCEYEFRNGAAGEEILFERIELIEESPPECKVEREPCAAVIRPLRTQCVVNNRLRPGNTCFISVEYQRVPTRVPQQTKLLILWKGRMAEALAPMQQFE